MSLLWTLHSSSWLETKHDSCSKSWLGTGNESFRQPRSLTIYDIHLNLSYIKNNYSWAGKMVQRVKCLLHKHDIENLHSDSQGASVTPAQGVGVNGLGKHSTSTPGLLNMCTHTHTNMCTHTLIYTCIHNHVYTNTQNCFYYYHYYWFLRQGLSM